MKELTTTLCAIWIIIHGAMAQSYDKQDFQTDIITNPSTSLRCYELNKQRKNKVWHKQNLKSLISRNDHLLNISKKDDDRDFYVKIVKTSVRLKYELELALQKIVNAEEALVKMGCPNLLQ
ncbi:MAG: hypothetical protein HN576_15265 [Bacteriovoracaceae bacterium]|jgi:hypothetical protein|nr:hypothetical protein [Bacteriovoracaceae bacterium]